MLQRSAPANDSPRNDHHTSSADCPPFPNLSSLCSLQPTEPAQNPQNLFPPFPHCLNSAGCSSLVKEEEPLGAAPGQPSPTQQCPHPVPASHLRLHRIQRPTSPSRVRRRSLPASLRPDPTHRHRPGPGSAAEIWATATPGQGANNTTTTRSTTNPLLLAPIPDTRTRRFPKTPHEPRPLASILRAPRRSSRRQESLLTQARPPHTIPRSSATRSMTHDRLPRYPIRREKATHTTREGILALVALVV